MKSLFRTQPQRLAILIDGNHLDCLCYIEFNVRIDHILLCQKIRDIVSERSGEQIKLFRTCHYGCSQVQGKEPSQYDAEATEKKEGFFRALEHIPRYTVKRGYIAYRGKGENGITTFREKMVDVLLALDAAKMALKKQVSHMAFITGDADYVPAFQLVKEEGIIVWLFHGPSKSKTTSRPTFSNELWAEADERCEIDARFMQDIEIKKKHQRGY